MTFFTNLEVTGILCIVRLVPEAKAGKEIPESSRLEFLEKFPASKKTYMEAINQNSSEPSFWEAIYFLFY